MKHIALRFNRYASLLLINIFLFSGCIITADPDDIDRVRGSGLLETQDIEVADFSRVSMALPGELFISQGLEESLTISAQANLLPYIEIFVEGDHLKIETEEGVNIEPTRTIVIELSVKTLDNLIFAGTGLVRVDTLATSNLSVTLAGSGNIEINQLTTINLETSLAGSGDLFFSGAVSEQNIVLAGSGDIEARELESETAEIEIAGSGSAVLNVTDELRVSIVGSGSVRYLGEPTVETVIVGSGSVTPLGG